MPSRSPSTSEPLHPSPLRGEGRVRGRREPATLAPSPPPLPRWGRGRRGGRVRRVGGSTVAMLLSAGTDLPPHAPEAPRPGGGPVFRVPHGPPSDGPPR